MNVNEINILVLAYLGDTIYEDYIRKFLIAKRLNNVNKLQKEAVKYVSAFNQCFYLKNMMDINFFTEEEIDVIKRARNYKSSTHPKNCDLITYKYATGLEALIGYLELNKRNDRIDEIMEFILGEKIC